MKFVDAFGHLDGSCDGTDQSTGYSDSLTNFPESGEFAGGVSDLVGATGNSSYLISTTGHLRDLVGATGRTGHFIAAPGNSSGFVGCSSALGLLYDAAIDVLGLTGKPGTFDVVQ